MSPSLLSRTEQHVCVGVCSRIQTQRFACVSFAVLVECVLLSSQSPSVLTEQPASASGFCRVQCGDL